MNVAPKTGQIALFCDDDHPVCITHRCRNSLFIERRESAQVNDLYRTTNAVDCVGSRGASLQYHGSPNYDGDAGWPTSITQGASLPRWYCIVCMGNLQVFAHCRTIVAFAFVWRVAVLALPEFG